MLELLSDRWWRLSNLYYIQDETGAEVKFTPNDAQRQLWDDIHANNVILKARQLGFSTFVAIFILDTCLFRGGTEAGIIDLNLDDAKKKLDKIKYAYKRLPEEIRAEISVVVENQHHLQWSNDSKVTVGVSHRGGTLQILHVSEFGKIAARFPDKAREIRTGAFGTIHNGSMIIVESTAEGAAGDYHDMVKTAQATKASGKKPSGQEFKLHFFPWHRHIGYVLPAESVVISSDMEEYFRELQAKHGISLSPEQKAWYTAKRKIVGPDDMFREYPSYADEAFYASIQGAYFAVQMTKAREERRIGTVPLDPSRPVNTFWDIGKNDNTTIWFHQNHGRMHHFVDYYENSGEGVEHYARILSEKASQRKWTYGVHYGPHDLDHSNWVLPGRETIKDVAARLGIKFHVVKRVPNKFDAIEAARNMLPTSWIDEKHCERGIQCLDNYRKEWDERRAHFRDEPLHDWASHGADGFMTGACGFRAVVAAATSERRRPRVGAVA